LLEAEIDSEAAKAHTGRHASDYSFHASNYLFSAGVRCVSISEPGASAGV
jgi:hypothetical protein